MEDEGREGELFPFHVSVLELGMEGKLILLVFVLDFTAKPESGCLIFLNLQCCQLNSNETLAQSGYYIIFLFNSSDTTY